MLALNSHQKTAYPSLGMLQCNGNNLLSQQEPQGVGSQENFDAPKLVGRHPEAVSVEECQDAALPALDPKCYYSVRSACRIFPADRQRFP